MAKALFLPSYVGGGFGHISRCLAMAAECEKRGWQTGIALGGPHLARLQAGAIPGRRQIFALNHASRRPRRASGAPAYTTIGDLNYQLVRDGLVTAKAIRAALNEALAVVRKLRPDVLVADVWPLAGLLGQVSGLPVVQIVRAILHPAAPNLIWWQPRPPGLVSPDLRPVFNPVLRSYGAAPIERGEDLLAGDLYLAPSFPALDPLPERLANTHYVGPLIRMPELDQSSGGAIPEAGPALNAWWAAQDPHLPLVYVSAGGGAEGVGSQEYYASLIEALAGMQGALKAIVAIGRRLDPAGFAPLPPHLHLEPWAPGPQVIARSRLVIYPGGYGTTMEMVRLGVPGLVIPAHTEQESNGRRLEAAGAARVILPAQSEPQQVWRDGPAGRFSFLVHPVQELSSQRLREHVQQALADPTLAEQARRLQSLAAPYAGAPLAVDYLEALCSGAIARQALPSPAPPGGSRPGWWRRLADWLQ